MRKTLICVVALLSALLSIYPAPCEGAGGPFPASAQISDLPEDFILPEDAGPEEIMSAALEIYSWFAMGTLDVDPFAPSADGTLFRVYDERLNTKAKLSSILHAYFSDEICRELLSSGVYREEDGYLYSGIDSREINPAIAETQYYISYEDGETQHITAAVFYSEEEGVITSMEEYTFLREKIDGKWLFTDFWFFW